MWKPRHLLWMLLLPASLAAQDNPLSTQRIESQTLAIERRFDGIVEAVHQGTLSSQVSGRIEEVLFDVDDFVEAGTLLVRFRDLDQQAGLSRAQAGLREAEARVRESGAELQRFQQLYQQNLVSKANLDRAEAEAKAAQARHKAARAELSQAEEQLEHTRVRAPYSGIVTERHVEPGETATLGQPLMSGLSLDRLRLSTQVPQTYVEAIRQHQTARVELPDGTNVESRDITLFPYAEAGSHSFRIRVELPEGLAGLYPGMLLKTAFTVGETERLLIPHTAVAQRSELTGVYVQDADGRLYFRQLRLGERRNGEVAVLAGLTAGETIALDPIAAGIALKQQRSQP
ncbi:MAG: efflux RND transporter periplasmic adaptor subunit [Gammaproteobacteria bacterium]|nr:efflux RND transporter periplasmic adaptor subunit [Gammaproteobacteria bacterium]